MAADEELRCSCPAGKTREWSDVGGPLPPVEKARSELALVKSPGEAEEPERLRVTAIPSSADAREEEPMR